MSDCTDDTGLQCECGDQRLRRLADDLLSNGIEKDFGRIVQIKFMRQVHPVREFLPVD
jgi:hypothetical protein